MGARSGPTLLRSRRLALTALLVAAPLTAASCGAPDPQTSAPSIGASPGLGRADWLAYTRRSLRRESCTHGEAFRRCSELHRDACEHALTPALARCATKMGAALPEHIAAGEPDAQARHELTGCMWHHAARALGPARLDVLCLLSSG